MLGSCVKTPFGSRVTPDARELLQLHCLPDDTPYRAVTSSSFLFEFFAFSVNEKHFSPTFLAGTLSLPSNHVASQEIEDSSENNISKSLICEISMKEFPRLISKRGRQQRVRWDWSYRKLSWNPRILGGSSSRVNLILCADFSRMAKANAEL
ncbi:uncharacterized protein CIMG_13701 [Coccidioides immitis RS]|uniref:Uncharacterized protein n=1 Tax=Coccidioides immitis (strain RS) TaxID=246410 RepID=A0A0D8JYZ9_COCIM|nr:uncharacterized protein CIMG_13701 [Coccidioides immitis RS]KJF61488.1 hypothetical protein CIMG_13701 [Coccidioides immitis RS]